MTEEKNVQEKPQEKPDKLMEKALNELARIPIQICMIDLFRLEKEAFGEKFNVNKIDKKQELPVRQYVTKRFNYILDPENNKSFDKDEIYSLILVDKNEMNDLKIDEYFKRLMNDVQPKFSKFLIKMYKKQMMHRITPPKEVEEKNVEVETEKTE